MDSNFMGVYIKAGRLFSYSLRNAQKFLYHAFNIRYTNYIGEGVADLWGCTTKTWVRIPWWALAEFVNIYH